MGWFWADTSATAAPASTPAATGCPVPHAARSRPAAAQDGQAPPAGCPMHKATIDAFTVSKHKRPTTDDAAPSACPVPHGQPQSAPKEKSLLSQLNPLNYMFPDLSNAPAPNQTVKLPTSREESSIPRADVANENWEYPSPQQMYHALLRKGYQDTDITAVEEMVAVHNFLNEGAWAEVVGWEKRFSSGLMKGWEACRRGEENAPEQLMKMREAYETEPTLIRFQGRPREMTPKAAFLQLMARVYPSKFGMEPPFDRHDWYVARNINGQTKEVRYVIDYYTGPPEPTGEPVFYLDVRPAMTPTGAAERFIRWGSDVWWRASGGSAREAEKQVKTT